MRNCNEIKQRRNKLCEYLELDERMLLRSEMDGTAERMEVSLVCAAKALHSSHNFDSNTTSACSPTRLVARASAHNESFEMRLINISISRCANWIKKSIKEKDESIITWQKNKEAHEDFQLDWISKDEAARRLLDAYEAQRNALLDPHTRNQAIESIEAVIWRNEGDGWGMAGDAQNIHMRMDGYDTWQEDFDRALDEDDDDEDLLDRDNSEVPHNPLSALQGSRRRSRRDGYSLAEGEEHFEQHQQHQQNLLSPTPVRGETEDLLQEATFKYAGLRLKDEPLEGADSGYDSGLTCAASTAEASSTLAPEGPKSMQAGLGGWDAPLERVSSEATWQAAFDAFNVGKGRVGDDLHATGYTGTRAVSMNGEGLEDWEYDYAQE
jgi:tetratricopeptide (TPR) repeat protein